MSGNADPFSVDLGEGQGMIKHTKRCPRPQGDLSAVIRLMSVFEYDTGETIRKICVIGRDVLIAERQDGIAVIDQLF